MRLKRDSLGFNQFRKLLKLHDEPLKLRDVMRQVSTGGMGCFPSQHGN